MYRFEVSAKQNKGLDEAFKFLISRVHRIKCESFRLSSQPKTPKRSSTFTNGEFSQFNFRKKRTKRKKFCCIL